MAVNGSLSVAPLESLLSAAAALLATPDVAGTAPIEAPPDGAIVTVEPALMVSEFCRICVAVRLAGFMPSPTVVLPE